VKTKKKIKPVAQVEVDSLADDQPPAQTPQPTGAWVPDLNPTQRKIFDDPSKFVLGHGEKGSGKTIGFAHKIIRHCYENSDALVLIITPSIRTGAEGVWHDLMTLIIPQWEEGIGLEHSDAKLDPNTKDRHIWIGNMHGGWSKILLISIPFSTQVEDRVKGPAPSFVYVDELTNCDGKEYFTFIAAQLGRRRGIIGPQQYTASCNPKGPSHWVYQVFFVDCMNAETGQRDADYSVYHVPISENIHRLPPGYYEQLGKIFKSDPIERRRLISGEWIDRPSGDAIFKDYWSVGIHLKGDAERRVGIKPLPGYTIDVGHDPGPVNYSVHFEQMIPVEGGKTITIVFDELNYVETRTPYHKIVKDIIRRMNYWRQKCEYNFVYEHIADEAAFNQLRGDGKYDNAEIERLSIDSETGRPRIRLKACPKGADSVPSRVRLVQSMLQEETLFVSALCPKTKDMLEHLISEKVPNGQYDKYAGLRPKRSRYIHPFDSMSYPIFYRTFGGGLQLTRSDIVEPQVYSFGRGNNA